jgi:hypothetical protein
MVYFETVLYRHAQFFIKIPMRKHDFVINANPAIAGSGDISLPNPAAIFNFNPRRKHGLKGCSPMRHDQLP